MLSNKLNFFLSICIIIINYLIWAFGLFFTVLLSISAKKKQKDYDKQKLVDKEDIMSSSSTSDEKIKTEIPQRVSAFKV